MANFEPDINHRIWQIVATIPQGKVATYGSVAEKAGMGRAARRIGHALRDLPLDTRIPWHRVVNAQGRIALPAGSSRHQAQRQRLEKEGISFGRHERIDLKQFGW
ncbi:MAG: methylated-DNA--[protein]-cysteine S-methyltransferase [Halioglobus sp.]|nr:methylated-DNA--[protein]-cysteine S-methyltransferase [Halioglobus sp.]